MIKLNSCEENIFAQLLNERRLTRLDEFIELFDQYFSVRKQFDYFFRFVSCDVSPCFRRVQNFNFTVKSFCKSLELEEFLCILLVLFDFFNGIKELFLEFDNHVRVLLSLTLIVHLSQLLNELLFYVDILKDFGFQILDLSFLGGQFVQDLLEQIRN